MNSETPRDSSVNSKTHKETYSPRIPFLLGRGGSKNLTKKAVIRNALKKEINKNKKNVMRNKFSLSFILLIL